MKTVTDGRGNFWREDERGPIQGLSGDASKPIAMYTGTKPVESKEATARREGQRGMCSLATTGHKVACASFNAGDKLCQGPCRMGLPTVSKPAREATASELEELGSYASERPACDGCKVRAGHVLREVANEPATRLAMLQEMHTEATQDLALAIAEQRPDDVHAHSEAVDACQELINYYTTL